jgi:hypothetical protein
MRQALVRMAIGFFVMMAALILINLAASKLSAAQEYGVYDWTHSHFNRGERGWASSAFQEQHGPRRGTGPAVTGRTGATTAPARW